jgi:hypothetical protein
MSARSRKANCSSSVSRSVIAIAAWYRFGIIGVCHHETLTPKA